MRIYCLEAYVVTILGNLEEKHYNGTISAYPYGNPYML